MIAAPDPHGQAAPTLRESLACLPGGPRSVGAGQAGDRVVGVVEAMGETAGASEDAVVSLASIPPPRTLAPGLAAASPIAAHAGA
jgi:hypothetical protein